MAMSSFLSHVSRRQRTVPIANETADTRNYDNTAAYDNDAAERQTTEDGTFPQSADNR